MNRLPALGMLAAETSSAAECPYCGGTRIVRKGKKRRQEYRNFNSERMIEGMRKGIAFFLAFLIGGAGCFMSGDLSASAQAGENREAGNLDESQDISDNSSQAEDQAGLDNSSQAEDQAGLDNGSQAEDQAGLDNGSQAESQSGLNNSTPQEAEKSDITTEEDKAGTAEGGNTKGDEQASAGEAVDDQTQDGGSMQDGSQTAADDNTLSGEKDSAGGGSEAGDAGLPGAEEDAESVPETPPESSGKSDAVGESEQVVKLQIPQKVNIVIDPWEIDERGQIYSDEYIIRNHGDTAGMLRLTKISCVPVGEAEVEIRTDAEGIHEGEETAIYMELAFSNGDKVNFSQEGSTYEIRLEPEAELSFHFSGEVNENAVRWLQGTDIEVTITYSWEEEIAAGQGAVPDASKTDLDSKPEEEMNPEEQRGTGNGGEAEKVTENEAGKGAERPSASVGEEEKPELDAGVQPDDEGEGSPSLDTGAAPDEEEKEQPGSDAGVQPDEGKEGSPRLDADAASNEEKKELSGSDEGELPGGDIMAGEGRTEPE